MIERGSVGEGVEESERERERGVGEMGGGGMEGGKEKNE